MRTSRKANAIVHAFTPLLFCALTLDIGAQNTSLPPLPAPLGVPKPGPANDAPYAPQPIVPGGVVVPLYPRNSPFLNKERVHEAEQYNMSNAVPGRIGSNRR